MNRTSSTYYRFLPSELADRLRGATIDVVRPVEGSVQGLHRSPHYGASVEFAEYRRYTRGDPVTLIDWAVYARSDKYMIRKFREETNVRGRILLDVSASMAFRGDGPMSKMEFACFLAASCMYVLVNQGDSAGMMTFNDEMCGEFGAVSTFEGLRPMLKELEAIEPEGGSAIERIMHDAAEKVSARSLFIIISDFLEDPALVMRGLQHLHHDGHDIALFHVLDASELKLGHTGLSEFRDMETGEKMIINADETRTAYEREVKNYIEELRAACAACMGTYRLLDTHTEIENSVFARSTKT